MDYKTSGVDVQGGRDFVQRIRASVESTYRPEVLGGLGGFGGFCRIPKGFSSPVLVAGTDGVGTKLELAQSYQAHFGVGVDLVAMCINDVITSGAKPLFFLDYIATGSLTPEAMTEVIEGIAEACRLTGTALLGGETAEMPGFYPKGKYDLAGFCVAVVEEENLIDGRNIKPGDQIIGVASSGAHSNGYSLIRNILFDKEVDENTSFGKLKTPLVKALLEPTFLYDKLVSGFFKQNVPLLGMAHITGGGLPENLPRILPEGCTANLDPQSWVRPELFQWLKQEGDIPESDLWNTFNLGVGFCLIVSNAVLNDALEICHAEGFDAWHIGNVDQGSTLNNKRVQGLPV